MPYKFNPFTGSLDETGATGATGTVSAAGAGTAAAPSISFAADTNTGLFNPGADQLAVATNGTARLYIASDGKIGVGTTSPLSPLVVSNGSNKNIEFQPGSPCYLLAYDRTASDYLDLDITAENLIFSTNNGTERLRITSAGLVGIGTTSPGGTLDIKAAASTHPLIVQGPSSEFARVDSSGRLLVGTSSARANFYNSTNSARFQIEGSGSNDNYTLSIVSNFAGGTNGAQVILAKSGGSSVGDNTLVSNDNTIGQINFQGADGTEFVEAASIRVAVDGTPGANDMPGRLVFSITADGAASPTEALRITNDRVIAYNQPTPTSKSAAATLTITELKTGIIQYTGAVATLTLPTGTLMEGGFSAMYNNMAFEWSVINTGAGICTVAAGTDHTVIGSGTVAIGASARFVSRRTAANTFVSYCLS